jgi:4-hydroxy-tetrahydrodipicolinate reductase
MGERVRAAVVESDQTVLCGALEAAGHPEVGAGLGPVTLCDDPGAALADAEVAIDFSIPAASLAAISAAAEAGVAYVCGTTGFAKAERTALETHASKIPVVWAANFSVSVNVLFHLTRRAGELLGSGYDAEIVELHHSAKRDAPSGTALVLAEQIAAARQQALGDHLVLERAGETGRRPSDAIGVQTLRGGDAAGEHTVLFIGRGERVELIHRAATRDHFAAGALRAAHWVVKQPPGFYGMTDVLGL